MRSLLLVVLFLVLSAVISFSVKSVLSVSQIPLDCEDRPTMSILTWCEEMRKKWYREPTLQCEGPYKGGGKPTKEEGFKEAVRVTNTFIFPTLQIQTAGYRWGVLLRRVGIGSFDRPVLQPTISAFSLGWRELNVGTWITRMQPREYMLRATGWVRTVSGIQSLLSVYLLALWVLT